VELLQIPGGSSIPDTRGSAPLGRSESQVPLVMLEPLPNPPVEEAEVPPDAAATFDANAVSKMFYDDLCCKKGGEECPTSASCCSGFRCEVNCGTAGSACVNRCCAPEGTFCGDAGAVPCCGFCNDEGICERPTRQ